MFGKAAKRAVQKAVSGIQREGLSASIKDLASETLQRIDEDNVLEELGDDLARGLLDRRYIVTEPMVFKLKLFGITIMRGEINPITLNIRKRRRGGSGLDGVDVTSL